MDAIEIKNDRSIIPHGKVIINLRIEAIGLR
jgi:hypothetical protein